MGAGVQPPPAVKKAGVHEEISAAARHVAAVISPFLDARLRAIYGPNWLDVVNARRGAAGFPSGRSLDDHQFCLAVFGSDPATSGWADERWRAFARELEALAGQAWHDDPVTPADVERAAQIETLFGTHFAPPAPAQLSEPAAAPLQPWEFIELSKAHLDGKRYDEVLAVAEQWRERHPDDWRPNAWIALAYEELGRWVEAAEAYRTCTAHAPDHVDLWRGLWLCAGKSGDAAAELSAARRWAELAPDDPHALACCALTFVGHGNPDEALETAERALAVDPEHRLGHLAYADALYRLQRWSEAVGAYRWCAGQDPQSAGAWKKMWTAAAYADDRTAAQEATAGWTAAAPEDAMAWQCHTRELTLAGRYAEAVDAGQRCLALDADNDQARRDYGVALYRSGDLHRLAAFVDRWPPLDPDLPGMLMQARALRDLGRYAAAVETATRITQRDPSAVGAWDIQAYALSKLDEPERAGEAAQHWVNLTPGDPDARVACVLALYEAGRWDQLVRFVDEGWPGSDRDPDVLTLKAKALQAVGRHADAVTVAEQAAQAGPLGRVPSGVWEVQARSLSELGQVDGAAAAARRLLQIDAQNPYFWFLLTQVYADAGRWEDALDAAEQWIEVEPSAEAWSRKVQALLGLRRYAEARPAADLLAELRPDDPTGLSLLVSAYAGCGELDEALRYAQRWLAVAPGSAEAQAALDRLRASVSAGGR